MVVLEVGSRSPSTGAPRTSRDSRRGSLRHEWALGAGLRCPREHPIWMSPYSERRLIQHAKQNIAQLSDGCPLQQSPSFFISLSKLTRRPESRIHSRGARRSLDSRPIPDDRSPSGGRPDRLAPDRSRPEGEPLGNTIGHSGPRHRSRHRPMVERNGVVFPAPDLECRRIFRRPHSLAE